jgi:hypothetical protein
LDDDELTVEVGDGTRELLIVPDIVAEQLGVFVVQLQGRHLGKAVEGVFCGEELSLGCGGGFEAGLGSDLVRGAEDGVHGGLFGVAGDVK